MAISYATTGFGFVDSQFGTAADSTGLKTLVNQVVDKKYHKQVRVKSFFFKPGLMGQDTYSDGSTEQTSPGFPIIRKTDLQSVSGDTIKMGIKEKLTIAHTNGGKVLDAQLVDNESALDFSSMKVSIERIRFGLRGNAGMNEQRNPYEPQGSMFEDSLKDAAAELVDTSILYAAACGHSPHLFRANGTTSCPPVEPVYTLVGNDTTLDTTRGIGTLQGAGADNVKALTFEVGAALAEQSNLDPVSIDGGDYWLVLISPKAGMILMQDDRFRNAWLYARERGKDNPVFKNAEFVYNNCIIYKYDKIRTILGGNNPAGLTVGSNNITEASYTGISGGVTASQLHQTLFLGANAVVYAEGQFKTGLIRAENDYNNIIGRATDLIFGCRRVRWVNEDANAYIEQGMVKVINTVIG